MRSLQMELLLWPPISGIITGPSVITRIELSNFMSHRNTVIEPAQGLTVLVGPNNCGKSAVITALQILAHNDNSTYVTRHGEKSCSVTVHTNDGHEVVWQRKGSSTSYNIDGKLYDRLRSGVPEELKEVLRLRKVELNTSNDQVDIHFGMQKQPVFLLNETGRAAAGFFAASSDAGRLIEMQKAHKEKVRSRKQDVRRLEAETEALQDEVDKLQMVDALSALLEKCDHSKQTLIDAERAAVGLKLMIEKIQSLVQKLNRSQKVEHEFDSLPKLPELQPTDVLTNIVAKVQRLTHKEKSLARLEATAEKLVPPPETQDTKGLATKLNELNNLQLHINRAKNEELVLQSLQQVPTFKDPSSAKKLLGESQAVEHRMAKLGDEDQLLAKQLNDLETEIGHFVDVNKTCPACLQPLKREQVVQHLRSTGGCREE